MHQRPRCVEQWSYNVSYIHQGMLPCAWIHTVDSDLLCGVWALCIQDIIRSWFLHLKLKQTPLFGWQRFHNTKFEIHFALMVRKNWNEVMSITSNIKWWQCFTAFYIFSIFSLGVMELCTKGLGGSVPQLKQKGVNLACVRTCVVVAEERPRIALTQSFTKLFSGLSLSPRAVSTSFGCRVNTAICLQVCKYW